MAGLFDRIRRNGRRRGAEHALARGRFALAAEGFRAAGTDDPVARIKAGLALWETGARTEGLALAREGSAALPPAHPARLFLALLCVEEDRLGEAAAVLDAVTAEDPGNLFASGLKALLRLRQGRAAEARALLAAGVFGSALFRAHLLLAVEKHLKKTLPAARWSQAYLEMVL